MGRPSFMEDAVHIYYELHPVPEDDMLYIDPTETRWLTELKEVAGQPVTVYDGLEEMSGADMMITPLNIPLAEKTFPIHLEAGAVLVQMKRGNDLVSSVGDRAASSLARMIDCGTFSQWQRILLFIGTLNFDGDTGAAIVNGRPNTYLGPQTYWAVQGTIEKWIERGGVYSNIPRMALLASWVGLKLTHLSEFMHEPIHSVPKSRPELYDSVEERVNGVPLQKLLLVRDWRNTLLTLPGIGEKRAEAVYQYVQQTCVNKTLFNALVFLTDDTLIVKMPGLGTSISRKIREWLGIDESMELTLKVKEVENAS